MTYACRDPKTCSLYPVSPGQTRRQLYCWKCTAKRCLFSGTVAEKRANLDNRPVIPAEFAKTLGISLTRLYQFRVAGMPIIQPGNHGRKSWLVAPVDARHWIYDNAPDHEWAKLFLDSSPESRETGSTGPCQSPTGLPHRTIDRKRPI